MSKLLKLCMFIILVISCTPVNAIGGGTTNVVDDSVVYRNGSNLNFFLGNNLEKQPRKSNEPTEPLIYIDSKNPDGSVVIRMQFNVMLSQDSIDLLKNEGWTVEIAQDNTHKATKTFTENTVFTYTLSSVDGVQFSFNYEVKEVIEHFIETSVFYICNNTLIGTPYTFESKKSTIDGEVIKEHLPSGYLIVNYKDSFDCIINQGDYDVHGRPVKQHVNVEIVSIDEAFKVIVSSGYNDNHTLANAELVFNAQLSDESINILTADGFIVTEHEGDNGPFGYGYTIMQINDLTEDFLKSYSGLKYVNGDTVPDFQVKLDEFLSAIITIVGLKDTYLVGDTQVFTVSVEQEYLDGKQVLFLINRNGATQEDIKLEYFDTVSNKWLELTQDYFGPASGFPLANATTKLRATFNKAKKGGYSFEIKLVDFNDKSIVYANQRVENIRVNSGENDMVIELDKQGPYTVGDTVNMTITTKATGNYENMMVKGVLKSNFDSSKVYAEYKDGDVWKELKGDSFGPSSGFQLQNNFTAEFRFTFKEAGNYTASIELVTADGTQELLSRCDIVAVVNNKSSIEKPNEDNNENKSVSTWDDGGPFTTNTKGDVFDRWGNLIYDSPTITYSSDGYYLVNTLDK